MIADSEKIVSFNCTRGLQGSGTGSLHYADVIGVQTEVVVYDVNQVSVPIFTGYVTGVSRTETGVGFSMELSDPLSVGMIDKVIWYQEPPSGFPKNGTKQEMIAWCEESGDDFYYRADGSYAFLPSGGSLITIEDNQAIGKTMRYGISPSGYYNRVVVNGSAEKEVAAEIQTISKTIAGVRFEETFQGNRPLSRTITAADRVTEETWDWDENNVCTRHYNLEQYPAPPQFGGNAKNQTETEDVVESYNADMSSYRIRQSIISQEWGVGITGPQTTENMRYTGAVEETLIVRNSDGTGSRETLRREIARNKYNSTRMVPVYERNAITGDWEKVGEESVTTPLYDYYQLLPVSKEQVIYWSRDGRSYSVTRTWSGQLNISGSNHSIVLSPSETTYGFDAPEQPEMEEAVVTINASVSYSKEIHPEYGIVERQIMLPNEKIPDRITTSSDLEAWLLLRAQRFATRQLGKSTGLVDECDVTLLLSRASGTTGGRLGRDIDIGRSCYLKMDGTTSYSYIEVYQVSHNMSASETRSVISGRRPSNSSVPRKPRQTFGGLSVAVMQALDKGQDNVRNASVVKPISSDKTLVRMGNGFYKIGNPKRGALNAGEDIQVYRATGTDIESGKVS